MSNQTLWSHVAVQFLYFLALAFNVQITDAVDRTLLFFGVDPSDTHVSLGAFIVFLVLSIAPIAYLIYCEFALKPHFAEHISFWWMRLEIVGAMILIYWLML